MALGWVFRSSELRSPRTKFPNNCILLVCFFHLKAIKKLSGHKKLYSHKKLCSLFKTCLFHTEVPSNEYKAWPQVSCISGRSFTSQDTDATPIIFPPLPSPLPGGRLLHRGAPCEAAGCPKRCHQVPCCCIPVQGQRRKWTSKFSLPYTVLYD